MTTGTTRLALLAMALVLVGCTTQRVSQKAPVVDRSTSRTPAAGETGTATPSAPVAAALPGAENAGKPGYFTVRPGDTLLHLGPGGLGGSVGAPNLLVFAHQRGQIDRHWRGMDAGDHQNAMRLERIQGRSHHGGHSSGFDHHVKRPFPTSLGQGFGHGLLSKIQ